MLETSDPAGGCSTEEDERNISGYILETFSQTRQGFIFLSIFEALGELDIKWQVFHPFSDYYPNISFFSLIQQ